MSSYNDNAPDNCSIGKADAETVFGMDHDYTKEDLDNAYHAAVEASISAGESDKLEELTAARDVLNEGFNAGAAVMSSDIKPIPSSYAGSSTSWSDIWDGFEKLDDLQSWWEEKMLPIDLSYAQNAAHSEARKKLSLPKGTDFPSRKKSDTLPLWYRIICKLVKAPIWRIAFIVLVILWGITDIQSNPDANIMDDAFNILFSWAGLVILMLINTIFGWFTNLIRWGIMALSNRLVIFQIKQQELSAARAYASEKQS